jgi:uncharacterized membrane protein YedE/YeeE
MTSFFPALVGGGLIGLAATVLLIANGRVAGISGIVAGLLGRDNARVLVNAAFVMGLLLGPVLFRMLFQAWPRVTVAGSLPLLAAAGLLVGFGTRLGSGCTSGHGVVGLARMSPRSIAAVAAFMAAAIATVFLMRQFGVP